MKAIRIVTAVVIAINTIAVIVPPHAVLPWYLVAALGVTAVISLLTDNSPSEHKLTEAEKQAVINEYYREIGRRRHG